MYGFVRTSTKADREKPAPASLSTIQGGRGDRAYTSSGHNDRGTVDGIILYCH